jgi:hypothetical protein
MVGMTRILKSSVTKLSKPRQRTRDRRPGRWRLQDAKARFTIHGRDEVVVIAAEDFRRLKGDATGGALVAAMQASPYRESELQPQRFRLPVRDVIL